MQPAVSRSLLTLNIDLLRFQFILVLNLSTTGMWCQFAGAQGNIVLALDGMIVNNTGDGQPTWGGFGRFGDGPSLIGPPTTPGLGRYDAFTFSEPGIGGGVVGINFAAPPGSVDSPADPVLSVISPVTAQMFPLLDRASFGASFDPQRYVAELVYKPLPGNTATQLNVTLDQTDGFTAAGLRRGEQWQWNFFDLVDHYLSAEKDADGFATIRNAGGALLGPNGERTAGDYGGANAPSYMYTDSPLPPGQEGDNEPDFDAFEGGRLSVPNGVVQIQLQTVFGPGAELVDNWEIKALRIAKIDHDPVEVARLDGRSGISLRFGSPFQNNRPIIIEGELYWPWHTDQLIRFDENGFLTNNSFIINTVDAGTDYGGFGIWQSPATTVFDGTIARMEIRARLTEPLQAGPGFAEQIRVVVKDKDGNGTNAPGDFGGEEYHFVIPLNQFNTDAMTTISMPFTAANVEQAQEFATPGDGMLTDFNLYYLGVLLEQGAAIVRLEVESIRITIVPEPGALALAGMGAAAGLAWCRRRGHCRYRVSVEDRLQYRIRQFPHDGHAGTRSLCSHGFRVLINNGGAT